MTGTPTGHRNDRFRHYCGQYDQFCVMLLHYVHVGAWVENFGVVRFGSIAQGLKPKLILRHLRHD